jgi:hypothetical protein
MGVQPVSTGCHCLLLRVVVGHQATLKDDYIFLSVEENFALAA